MFKKISIVMIILLSTVGCSAQANDTTKTVEIEQVDVEKEEMDYARSAYITGLAINLSSLENLQMCAKTSEVWLAAINLGRDFDNELAKLYKEAEDKGVIKDLTDDKKLIDIQMNELNNPPEKYQKLYDKLLELYGEYTLAHEFAVSPSGSLAIYNESINENYSEITRLNNEFKALVPQEIIKEIEIKK